MPLLIASSDAAVMAANPPTIHSPMAIDMAYNNVKMAAGEFQVDDVEMVNRELGKVEALKWWQES